MLTGGEEEQFLDELDDIQVTPTHPALCGDMQISTSADTARRKHQHKTCRMAC